MRRIRIRRPGDLPVAVPKPTPILAPKKERKPAHEGVLYSPKSWAERPIRMRAWQTLVNLCEMNELTEWETNFVASIRLRLEGDGELSEKQALHLNRIVQQSAHRGRR